MSRNNSNTYFDDTFHYNSDATLNNWLAHFFGDEQFDPSIELTVFEQPEYDEVPDASMMAEPDHSFDNDSENDAESDE